MSGRQSQNNSCNAIRAVIGKGFGDEGKGLAVDYFCRQGPHTLVIKHNGGAQAGHTVELKDGRKFVFHQLSSGSFRHCDTFWADTYYPDLFKLRDEINAFRAVSGFVPQIYCDLLTPVTLIDDILINMLLETSRGNARHGSCGMGINEAFLRTEAGFDLTVGDLLSDTVARIVRRILSIRKDYTKKRLEAAGLSHQFISASEYGELLNSRSVIENAVEEMARSAHDFVQPAENASKLLKSYPELIFETGQGLLLDAENETFAPHVTASRTGLINPLKLLKKCGLELTEAVYVSRTYVTRHGAGPLPNECPREALGIVQRDETNVDNPWQGAIRYARHGSLEDFLDPVRKDVRENIHDPMPRPKLSLFLTHLNETNHCICFAKKNMSCDMFAALPEVRDTFGTYYLSTSRHGEDVCTLDATSFYPPF